MSKLAPLLSKDIIERAESLNTTLISDAMGCTGSMDYKIKPVASGMKVVGTALTVSLRPGDNLFLHQAIYDGKEGYVLVADGKGHTTNAYLGELMAGAAKAMGIEGIIIDGLVRDKETLSESDFPIFAKGFIPNGPLKDGPGELHKPISCGGVSVVPGDLIIGDDDGVVVVPKDKIEEVLSKAEKKLDYEKTRLENIAAYEKARTEGRPGGNIQPHWLREQMKAYGL
ncbi:S-adenosylmethionine--2-demethylmenaquinone methyltransferase [Priestia filamentosa]|uniref:S-adenosylmethionine--2-demethylmenaquinone methyltransferase n=1 Tax=Priestia filamentosa TaxID=1402861 RepID=UPI000588FC74|nr:S-adenosylmethionine--2-demethylmenaquinone methyltransferase [Priestia filamentosa]MDT3765789.1 S-adenosylmethionine--2-demethylmenaquinone methyltransferase [Priestia filamentosa]OXS65240.1 S-adenosylmethionine--2-demethylmenaquinone methyltransferase [Priestia filamentosa]RJS62866.1 S-adenosylmethionine--2-demethylmenaquinone methyltransferase [Priestia filamentosa]SMF69608.1 Regulator of RNase E activity RraA [Priestia filamentosa]